MIAPATSTRGRWCRDRKSTRLNSSHVKISYDVFCLKKKKCESLILICRGQRLEHNEPLRLPATAMWRKRIADPPPCLSVPGGVVVFFFNVTATTEIYTLSLHDALPI